MSGESPSIKIGFLKAYIELPSIVNLPEEEKTCVYQGDLLSKAFRLAEHKGHRAILIKTWPNPLIALMVVSSNTLQGFVQKYVLENGWTPEPNLWADMKQIFASIEKLDEHLEEVYFAKKRNEPDPTDMTMIDTSLNLFGTYHEKWQKLRAALINGQWWKRVSPRFFEIVTRAMQAGVGHSEDFPNEVSTKKARENFQRDLVKELPKSCPWTFSRRGEKLLVVKRRSSKRQKKD